MDAQIRQESNLIDSISGIGAICPTCSQEINWAYVEELVTRCGQKHTQTHH